jgi:transcriptional regulator with XRE-family HTH domain
MIGGELVREARRRAGLTQQQLAERAGVSQPAIARLESARTSPSFEQVQRLIRLCGFDVLVELAVRDDSDRIQARPGADPTSRIHRLAMSRRQLSKLREDATRGT